MMNYLSLKNERFWVFIKDVDGLKASELWLFVTVLKSHLEVVLVLLRGLTLNNFVQAEGRCERGDCDWMVEVPILIEPLGSSGVLVGRFKSLVDGSQVLQTAL